MVNAGDKVRVLPSIGAHMISLRVKKAQVVLWNALTAKPWLRHIPAHRPFDTVPSHFRTPCGAAQNGQAGRHSRGQAVRGRHGREKGRSPGPRKADRYPRSRSRAQQLHLRPWRGRKNRQRPAPTPLHGRRATSTRPSLPLPWPTSLIYRGAQRWVRPRGIAQGAARRNIHHGPTNSRRARKKAALQRSFCRGGNPTT